MSGIFNLKSLMILIVCILGGIAAYMIIAAVTKQPTQKAVDTLLKASQGNIKKVPFEALSRKLSRFVKLEPEKKEKLQRALDLSGETTTPEDFVAQKWIMAILVSVLFSVLLLISKPMGIVGIALGPLVGYLQYQEAFKKLKTHKAAIEREVPRFTQTVHENLKVSRNVLSILESYQGVAGKAMAYELQKTIADMKTSNYETALVRLDRRIGSQPLSEVVRGLIGTLRGNDQTTYFDHLAFEMKHLEENMIRKEAMKRPEKMQRLSMAMLVGVFCMLAAVCGTMLIQSFEIFESV